MKSIIFIACLLVSASALATTIDLQAGNSITIKAGDTATVTCSGSGSDPVAVVGAFSGYCNSSALELSLDTSTKSNSQEITLANPNACSNALNAIKSNFGEFTGFKLVKFCNSSVMVKLRVSADVGTIEITNTQMSNPNACTNAL